MGPTHRRLPSGKPASTHHPLSTSQYKELWLVTMNAKPLPGTRHPQLSVIPADKAIAVNLEQLEAAVANGAEPAKLYLVVGIGATESEALKIRHALDQIMRIRKTVLEAN